MMRRIYGLSWVIGLAGLAYGSLVLTSPSLGIYRNGLQKALARGSQDMLSWDYLAWYWSPTEDTLMLIAIVTAVSLGVAILMTLGRFVRWLWRGWGEATAPMQEPNEAGRLT